MTSCYCNKSFSAGLTSLSKLLWSCHQASSWSACFIQHLTSSQPHFCTQALRAFLSSFELCQWPGREAGKWACNHHKAGRKQQWRWNPPIQLSYKTILLTILPPWPHLSSLTRKEQTNCFCPWWGRKREISLLFWHLGSTHIQWQRVLIQDPRQAD